MPIAFFDLDRTLLSKNSGTLWVRSELKGGFITAWQALKAVLWIARYELGAAKMEKVLLESVASLAGALEDEVRQRTQRFYESEVRQLVRPGARVALARHRSRGDALVLLTSSSNYLSEPVVAQLGLDGYLCNRFETDAQGRYTGRPLGPLCFGPGKVEHARAFAASRGESLADCAFYTDSSSDLPMLEAVGHPVVVNPDPKLRRLARRRGWPVEDWGEPPRPGSGD